MSLLAAVRAVDGREDPGFVSLDVSGQEISGGSSGSDKPVYLNGVAYRFNCADEDWCFQYSPRYPNLLRSEIRLGYRAPYDEFNDRDYLRTELTESDRTGNTGLEQWQSFDVMIVDGSDLRPYTPGGPQGQASVCQMKMFPDPTDGHPMFWIEARSNCVRIGIAYGAGGDGVASSTSDAYVGTPMTEGVWENFTTRAVRSADGLTNGSFEVWRNRSKIVNLSGIALGRGDTQYIWNKFGLYCRNTVVAATVLHANMLRGTDLSYLLTRPAPQPYLDY